MFLTPKSGFIVKFDSSLCKTNDLSIFHGCPFQLGKICYTMFYLELGDGVGDGRGRRGNGRVVDDLALVFHYKPFVTMETNAIL